MRIISHVGEALPLHCTAAGKVHLAFEPLEEVQRDLPEGLARYTDTTIVDRLVLIEQLKTIATAGYALENCEYQNDVRTVAAPRHRRTQVTSRHSRSTHAKVCGRSTTMCR